MNDVENRMVVNDLWPDDIPDSDFPRCDYCGELFPDHGFLFSSVRITEGR